MLWHCLNSGSDFFHTVSEAKSYPQMESAIAILFEIFLHFTKINWYFERLLNRYKYFIILHSLLDGEQFSFASGRFCVFCTNIWTFKWERVIVKSHSFEIGGLRYERNDIQENRTGNNRRETG